jgi:competence protein ComEA
MIRLLRPLVVLLLFIANLAYAAMDLNSASKSDLQSLLGVGPAIANAIVAARPFHSVEELKNIDGISDRKFKKIAPLVAISTAQTESRPGTRRIQSTVRDLAPNEMVNINTASRTDLERLPEIGPQRADAIIAGRPYDKAEDVMKVKGIKTGVFAKIKDHIVVR